MRCSSADLQQIPLHIGLSLMSSPTVVAYACLICGFCQSNNVDEAMTLLEDMSNKGIEPNVFTYSSLMDGLCKSGRSSEAMELLQILIHEHKVPNMITYSNLIHGLCGEGEIGEALDIFDRMELQGCKPDAGLYWKVINGFCEINQFHEAASYLVELISSEISPNWLTRSLHVKIHNAVVQVLCAVNDPKRAFQLYLSMRTRAISVEAKSFESLVNHCCRRGDMHKVARIVEEILADGCIPDEQTWAVVVGGF